MKDLTIIMTAYNCEDTIYNAVQSVLTAGYNDKIELVVVNDCSKDSTLQILKELEIKYDNLNLFSTDENTGSPSIPRNIGIKNAKGKYLTFLDDDDYLDMLALLEKLEYMNNKKLDVLLSNLYSINTNSSELVNDIDDKLLSDLMSYEKRVANIFTYLSTRVDFIIKSSFIQENNNIRFDSNFKLGEDTLLYAEIFRAKPKFEYVKIPHYYYVRINNNLDNKSTTQNYSDFELNQHMNVWKKVEKILKDIEISYFECRLSTAFRLTLTSLVKYSNAKISRESFKEFSKFTREYKKYLGIKCGLSDRYNEIYVTLLSENYEKFIESIKKRILINGYDLKFILPIIPYLEKTYIVKVDEWTGHNIHDEKKSSELLNWADIIFCEWLLGNSAWYSKHKLNYQVLIIRAHRFEVGREFGYQVDYNNIDSVLTVSYFFLNLFKDKFKIPKHKIRLLSNYVDSHIYSGSKENNFEKNIAICGILPSRKGFFEGLKIIDKLVKIDAQYKLYIVGDRPESIEWIRNNLVEKEYFDKCYNFIKENNLTDKVIFKGRQDREKMFNNIGFVLSLSQDEEIPESFHLTPAEGALDGSISLIKKWRGSEYIYNDEFIYGGIDEIVQEILKCSVDNNLFIKKQNTQKKYIYENYDINIFLENLENIIELLVMNK